MSSEQHLPAAMKRLVPARWLVATCTGLAAVLSLALYVVPGVLQEPIISVLSGFIVVSLVVSFIGGVWLFAVLRENVWLQLAFVSIVIAFVFFSFLVAFGMSRLH